MATLHIQLFGSFHISYDAVFEVEIRQVRVQALLAYLLLHRHAPQTRQQLAFLFWPDSSEGQAHNNLRKLLFQLRTYLPDAESFLHVTNYAVQWRVDSAYVADIVEFEQGCDTAMQADGSTDGAALRAGLEAAVGRYTGDLLPGCYDDWIAVERERLRERYLDALTRLIDHLEQLHDLAGAIGYANRLLRTDPLHEATYRRLMRLQALDGDRAAALRTYHACATILRNELGVEPGPRTQATYARLLRPEEAQAEQPLPPPSRSAGAQDVLIGRQAEWQALLTAWRRAEQGDAQCVVIAGEAGIDDDSLVRGLDELWRRRIVREQGADDYDFSHDLIREAAELAISTVHRRLLHRRVEEALEEIHGSDRSAFSLRIASHYEQAGILEPAIAHYIQAAETARYIFAAQEAIGHYTQALTLLRTLPTTPERTEQQVDILLALGATWSSSKTCSAPEAKQAYDEAFALCLHMDMSPSLFTALWGLHEFHLYRSEYQRSLETAEQCLRIAEHLQDSALLLEAHHAMWGALLYYNRYTAAIEHVGQGIAVYDREQHHRLAFQYGIHDPAHCGLSIASNALWMSGYPDQATQRLQDAIQFAEQLQIPVCLADAYFNHAQIYHLLRAPAAVRTWAEATIQLANQLEYPFCQAVGSVLLGWAIVALGDPQPGLALLNKGLVMWKAEGIRNMQTYMHVMLAEAYQVAGQIDRALLAVEEGQDFATEFDEHYFEPELYRLQGELLQASSGPPLKIEQCFQQGLALARRQEARSLELRIATSLAYFWAARGKCREAMDLLSGVFGWFSEGFATPDLKQAQAALVTLAA